MSETNLLEERVASQLREQQLEEELMRLAVQACGDWREDRLARRQRLHEANETSKCQDQDQDQDVVENEDVVPSKKIVHGGMHPVPVDSTPPATWLHKSIADETSCDLRDSHLVRNETPSQSDVDEWNGVGGLEHQYRQQMNQADGFEHQQQVSQQANFEHQQQMNQQANFAPTAEDDRPPQRAAPKLAADDEPPKRAAPKLEVVEPPKFIVPKKPIARPPGIRRAPPHAPAIEKKVRVPTFRVPLKPIPAPKSAAAMRPPPGIDLESMPPAPEREVPPPSPRRDAAPPPALQHPMPMRAGANASLTIGQDQPPARRAPSPRLTIDQDQPPARRPPTPNNGAQPPARRPSSPNNGAQPPARQPPRPPPKKRS
jgi:hypothetical protein